jgi:hypothetical protein
LRSAVQNQTNQLIEHFNFLDPLWNVPNMNSRFAFISRDHRPFNFKGIYVQLADNSRFTAEPPADLKDHFEIHRMNVPDTIKAHMNIFSEQLDVNAYHQLLGNIVSTLSEWI